MVNSMHTTPAPTATTPLPLDARFILLCDLVVTPHDAGDESHYVVEDPRRQKFFRIGWREYAVLARLDGTRPIGAVLAQAANDRGGLAAEEAWAVCQWAVQAQLVVAANSHEASSTSPSPLAAPRRAASGWWPAHFSPMYIQIPICNPDRALAALLPAVRWLFSKPSVLVWLLTIAVAVIEAARHAGDMATIAPQILHPDNWLRMFVAWTGLKILHEFGHALACKRFGGHVYRAGVALIMFAPVAFVDVTESWRFRSRWQRIVTAAAGIYVECFVAALAVFVWTRSTDPQLQTFALDICLIASLHTLLANANPLMRFDGYYILSDLAGIPNLYSSAQQELCGAIRRHVFGHATSASTTSGWRRRFVAAYAWAALAWRISFYATFAIVILGLADRIGEQIANALAVAWLAWPVLRTVQTIGRIGFRPWPKPLRLVMVSAAASAALAASVWGLSRPATLSAPGVVEFSPLHVVRVDSPGFVRVVRVRDGQQVAAAEILAELHNDELTLELADLDQQRELCRLREQGFASNREVAKQQVAAAQRQSLEKRQQELRTKVDGLLVRAPIAGRVMARRVEELIGQYLQAGTQLVTVGDERSKELLVVIPQDEVDLFSSRAGQTVTVRLRGGGPPLDGRLMKIDPSAQVHLPHAALSGACHGPIAVKPRPPSDSPEKANDNYESLAPVFIGHVQIVGDSSKSLRAGQVATIALAASDATWFASFQRGVCRWVRQRLPNTTGN